MKTTLIKIILLISTFFMLINTTSIAIQEPEDTQTNYNIISEKDQEKIKEFITIKKDYEKFCIIEGITILIILIVILKTTAIENSSKVALAIAILALGTYILKFSVEGNILPLIDVTVQILGAILLGFSAFYIYKNENLLIYIPIYIGAIIYIIKEIPIINENILYKLLLITLPFILIILGKIINAKKEKDLLKPVKEKHERK